MAGNNQTSVPASRAATIENSPARDDIAAAVPASSGDTKDEESDSPSSVRGRRDEPSVFVKARFNNRQPAPTRGDGGNAENGNTTIAAAAAKPEPVLEDEKTYISSIASLTSAIEAQGASGLTPTLRAEYERNLAVVNQAIISSRVAARRNPQDTDAKEFLRAAYQNKVELLSAVADQAQIASSRD
jgi:hypothetical protein